MNEVLASEVEEFLSAGPVVKFRHVLQAAGHQRVAPPERQGLAAMDRKAV